MIGTLLARFHMSSLYIVTMLDWEFYTFNATTALLWLFQNFDHELLIALFALGVLCVSAALWLIALRLVSSTAKALLFILNVLINKILLNLIRPHPLSPLLVSSDLFDSESNSLDRLFLANDGALASRNSPDGRLSLPRSLALHPLQWSELEPRPALSPPPSPAQSAQAPSADSCDAPRSSSLRRSRRAPRHVSYSTSLAIDEPLALVFSRSFGFLFCTC